MHTTLRPSIATYKSAGILTCCPSGAAFAIPLGPTNPWLIDIAKETASLSARAVFMRVVVTCANILTSQRSSVGHPFTFTADANTLLPLVSFIKRDDFKKQKSIKKTFKVPLQIWVATVGGLEPSFTP